MSDIIVLNVGGQKHEVYRSVLASKPDTKLFLELEAHKRNDMDEYFFDRNAQVGDLNFKPIWNVLLFMHIAFSDWDISQICISRHVYCLIGLTDFYGMPLSSSILPFRTHRHFFLLKCMRFCQQSFMSIFCLVGYEKTLWSRGWWVCYVISQH